jgi:hypothetical protein
LAKLRSRRLDCWFLDLLEKLATGLASYWPLPPAWKLAAWLLLLPSVAAAACRNWLPACWIAGCCCLLDWLLLPAGIAAAACWKLLTAAAAGLLAG